MNGQKFCIFHIVDAIALDPFELGRSNHISGK